MYGEFYKGHPLIAFPIFAMLFFVGFFIVAVAIAWRRKAAGDAMALLPLNDELPLNHDPAPPAPLPESKDV